MHGGAERTIGGNGYGRTTTVTAVAPGLAPERKLLSPGNVAIVRRHTDNAHRLFFCVEIGKILPFPYPRGGTPKETETRIDNLESAQLARSSGRITDEFVVGRKGNASLLIGIKPIDPTRRILTVEAPKDADGKQHKVILRVPGNKSTSVTRDSSFLETLGDLKEGTIFNPVVSQFFYDVQQGLFSAEPTGETDY
jgi:hypothetical protein